MLAVVSLGAHIHGFPPCVWHGQRALAFVCLSKLFDMAAHVENLLDYWILLVNFLRLKAYYTYCRPGLTVCVDWWKNAELTLSVESGKIIVPLKSKVPFVFLFRQKWSGCFRLFYVQLLLFYDFVIPAPHYWFKIAKKFFFYSKVPFVLLFRQKWRLFQVVLGPVIIVLRLRNFGATLSIQNRKRKLFFQEWSTFCIFVPAKIIVVLCCSSSSYYCSAVL